MRPRRTPPSPLPVEPYWQGLPNNRELMLLLQGIATEPWGEDHRLVLADWLDDHGEGTRAEFIRTHSRCPTRGRAAADPGSSSPQ
jgi:uncharacterized protein (TIGR02996 family)